IGRRIGPLLKSASTSAPARSRLWCKREWMSGRSLQADLGPEQDARSPAPNRSRLPPPASPPRQLTDRHSFQTLSTRAAQSKARRKALAHSAASVPPPVRELSILREQESGRTEFLFPFVGCGPCQQLLSRCR